MSGEMRDRTSLSMTLEMQHRREMGRYEEGHPGGLEGLGMGMMCACLQILGIVLWSQDVLKRSVSAEMPCLPRCFR